MLQAGLDEKLSAFALDMDRLPALSQFVAGVIRNNYPSLQVPLHARWRHFSLGGRDLWAEIAARAAWPDKAAKARAAFDLAIVSVLLDAGAGPDWRYRDAETGIVVGRSEGLALASLRMFEAGLLSAHSQDRLRADATRLMQISAADLAKAFQVTAHNPMTGLDGRAALLVRLGRVVAGNPAVFAIAGDPRPGGLFDCLTRAQTRIDAGDVLHALLVHLGTIWPGRPVLGGFPLGDTWRHPAIRRDDATDTLVPLHKLSQWLAYSLVEPLIEAGIEVTGLGALTGLAEYRNGGLFVDGGIVRLRDPAAAMQPNDVGSALVVEWRALTVALLDAIAAPLRRALGVAEPAFPLGCILEGGTWTAGRMLARERRADGSPPIRVESDGTVF